MAVDNPSPYTAQILAELKTQNEVNYRTVVDPLLAVHIDNSYGITTLSGLADLTTFTSAAENELTSLQGLEYARGLTSLTANGNSIVDAQISSFTSITYIHLAYNKIIEVRALQLDKLTHLYLNSNKLEETELNQLIEDIWVNRVALGALSCVINLANNTGSAASAISKATEITDLQNAGCSFSI